MRKLLQNPTTLLQNTTVIKKCDVYYKLRQYTGLNTSMEERKEFPEKNYMKLGQNICWIKLMIQETQKENRAVEDHERLWFWAGKWPRYPSQPKRNWDWNGNTVSICSSDCKIWPWIAKFDQTNKYTTVN